LHTNQENLSLIKKTKLDPISELERIEYLRELINRFPKDHPLKRYRGDAYYEINNLKSLFSTMKREGWSPNFVNEKIDEYLKDIETREEYILQEASGNTRLGTRCKQDQEKDRMEKLGAAQMNLKIFSS
jgi:DNA helicase-2/ATP-dependent DNA helicase PcrA